MAFPLHFERLVVAIDDLLTHTLVPAIRSPTDDLIPLYPPLVPLYTHVPESFTFADLLAAVRELGPKKVINGLLLILVCLKNDWADPDDVDRKDVSNSRILDVKDHQDYLPDLEKLCEQVALQIAPTSRHVKNLEENLAEYDKAAQRSLSRARYGLEILRLCRFKFDLMFTTKEVQLTLMSFAATWQADRPPRGVQVQFPWTTWRLALTAKELLPPVRDEVLIELCLKHYLRDLFSKSKPRAVTASGRKAEYPDEDDPHRALQDETSDSKPWKYRDHRAIAVFQYVVLRVARCVIVKERWLFVPVLLTLIEDSTPRVRASGLFILNEFLKKSCSEDLRNSGLVGVFKNAIFSSLHLLPGSTMTETESAKVLKPAYLALQTLSPMVEEEPKFLDEVLRDGIFPAYSHTREHYLDITMILANQANWILPRLRLFAVKHLKDLLLMHCETLANPFADQAEPIDLWGAIASLERIIETCWPRLSTPAYQYQIINAIVCCFLNTYDNEPVPDYDFKSQLSIVASMITTVVSCAGDGDRLKAELASLVAKEPKLAGLFKEV